MSAFCKRRKTISKSVKRREQDTDIDNMSSSESGKSQLDIYYVTHTAKVYTGYLGNVSDMPITT